MVPLLTLLGLFIPVGNPAEAIFGDLRREYQAKITGQPLIETYFKRKTAVKDTLLTVD
jgi:hypothetical protein